MYVGNLLGTDFNTDDLAGETSFTLTVGSFLKDVATSLGDDGVT